MKTRDLYKLSTRMFKARTSRTLLTILGMGVGISAIMFLVSLGYGIQNALLETIVTTDSLLSLDVYPGKADTGGISLENIEKIRNIPGVSQISPAYQTKAKVKFNEFTSDSQALVIDPDFLSLNGTKITGGSSINDGDIQGVVITPTFARIFNKTPEEMIGQSINFSLLKEDNSNGVKKTTDINVDKDFRIIGYADSKENIIYINSKSLSDVLSLESYSRLKVKCTSSNVVGQVREQIIGNGFIVSALTDIVDQANKVFKVVRIILGFFGIIALLVSAIGMFNTMTVTLLERTEEIGIMKSIGAYDSNILSMFVAESTVMGFLGGVSGVVLAFLEGKIFNLGINLVATHFGGQKVDLFYTPLWFFFFILFSAGMVGFLTGIIPAKRASSIDPLEALRYK